MVSSGSGWFWAITDGFGWMASGGCGWFWVVPDTFWCFQVTSGSFGWIRVVCYFSSYEEVVRKRKIWILKTWMKIGNLLFVIIENMKRVYKTRRIVIFLVTIWSQKIRHKKDSVFAPLVIIFDTFHCLISSQVLYHSYSLVEYSLEATDHRRSTKYSCFRNSAKLLEIILGGVFGSKAANHDLKKTSSQFFCQKFFKYARTGENLIADTRPMSLTLFWHLYCLLLKKIQTFL